jgi:hypothetical protein
MREHTGEEMSPAESRLERAERRCAELAAENDRLCARLRKMARRYKEARKAWADMHEVAGRYIRETQALERAAHEAHERAREVAAEMREHAETEGYEDAADISTACRIAAMYRASRHLCALDHRLQKALEQRQAKSRIAALEGRAQQGELVAEEMREHADEWERRIDCPTPKLLRSWADQLDGGE